MFYLNADQNLYPLSSKECVLTFFSLLNILLELEQLNNLEAFTFKGLQNTSAALHQCEGF
jgi:hypothetical protein